MKGVMMSVINKDLYDALVKAGCDDAIATKAAVSETEIKTDVADLKARLSILEKLQWLILAVVLATFLKEFF